MCSKMCDPQPCVSARLALAGAILTAGGESRTSCKLPEEIPLLLSAFKPEAASWKIDGLTLDSAKNFSLVVSTCRVQPSSPGHWLLLKVW